MGAALRRLAVQRSFPRTSSRPPDLYQRPEVPDRLMGHNTDVRIVPSQRQFALRVIVIRTCRESRCGRSAHESVCAPGWHPAAYGSSAPSVTPCHLPKSASLVGSPPRHQILSPSVPAPACPVAFRFGGAGRGYRRRRPKLWLFWTKGKVQCLPRYSDPHAIASRKPSSSPWTVGVIRLTPASGADSIFIEDRPAIAHYGFQISTVAAFYQRICECHDLLCIDVFLFSVSSRQATLRPDASMTMK